MLRELNQTNLAVIPKIQQLESFKDFRPIGLCNMLYKVITKVLANRAKKIPGDVISPFQSAFIKNICNKNNIIIIGEILSYIRQHKK